MSNSTPTVKPISLVEDRLFADRSLPWDSSGKVDVWVIVEESGEILERY
jgi:hypothetical protein